MGDTASWKIPRAQQTGGATLQSQLHRGLHVPAFHKDAFAAAVFSPYTAEHIHKRPAKTVSAVLHSWVGPHSRWADDT